MYVRIALLDSERTKKMKNFVAWIRRHPVGAFFLFAFTISWTAEIIYFNSPELSFAIQLLGVFAVLSPALGAAIISGIQDPHPKSESRKPRWTAFAISLLFCAPILFFYSMQIIQLDWEAAAINGIILGLVPAWIFSNAYARTPGIRNHFSTLVRPRGPLSGYLLILMVFPGVQLLSIGIVNLFPDKFYTSPSELGFREPVVFILLNFLVGFLMTGGINEETGWRGFALPRLQARYSVLVSTLIVWFFWAAWHLPYDFGRGIPIPAIIENRVLWNLVMSILMTWIYNRTNGSILAVALFHPLMNTFGDYLNAGGLPGFFFIGLALFAILYDRMWKKLPPGHSAVYQPPAQQLE